MRIKILVKNMDKNIEDFIKEYSVFKKFAEQQRINNESTILQLFAIYRKDKRSKNIESINNNQSATEKQKAYVKKIYEINGKNYNEEDLQKLTKKEASNIIESFKKGLS
jgi:hypothetical protein